MNTLLDSIFGIYKTTYISDSNFTSFRYERKLEELILDALARYIFNYIEKSKKTNEKCCSLLLVKESDQPLAKISKILISVNEQQCNNELITKNSNMLTNLLKYEFEDIFKVNSEWFDNIKNRIIEHLNDELKVTLNEKNIEKFKGSKEFIQAILDSIQNSDVNFALYDELLQFLRSIMDIYLITLFGSYYWVKNYRVWDVLKKPNHINNASCPTKESSQIVTFHCESKLAVYCACKFNRNYINEYIGISKLCCPLCANLLYQLQFKFRGSHSSFSSATNWSLLHSKILEDKDLDKIKEPLNKFSTDYLKSLKNELEKLKTIKKKDKYIDLKERIYNLTCPQSLDFIPDRFIFDYGQKFRNISLNDFKILKAIIDENTKNKIENIEKDHLIDDENSKDILIIIGFYERLMKKINIEILKIFQKETQSIIQDKSFFNSLNQELIKIEKDQEIEVITFEELLEKFYKNVPFNEKKAFFDFQYFTFCLRLATTRIMKLDGKRIKEISYSRGFVLS